MTCLGFRALLPHPTHCVMCAAVVGAEWRSRGVNEEEEEAGELAAANERAVSSGAYAVQSCRVPTEQRRPSVAARLSIPSSRIPGAWRYATEDGGEDPFFVLSPVFLITVTPDR